MRTLREGGGRWMLALVVGCLALLVLAPVASAALPTGEISGVVTELTKSEDIVPLQNIEVTAYDETGKEFFVESALTNAAGEYSIEGLPEGEYEVEFSGGLENGRNFVTQFYDAKSSYSAAELVKVLSGETMQGIDAEMEVGGEIEGTVTNAVTHKPLQNLAVSAIGAGETEIGFALTESDGHYVITGMPVGSYKVRFAGSEIFAGTGGAEPAGLGDLPGSGYVPQYYNDQQSFASANPVSVVREASVSGVDAAMMPKEPINTAPPVLSGTPTVGQTLSCTSGSWTGTPAPTFAYSWLRDGVAIAGASGRAYVVQAADVGNGLTCKVLATNKSGSVAALSNTLIVPVPPPPPPPAPLLELTGLAGAKLVVSGGSVRVPVVCAGAACTGTIELRGQIVVKHRRGRRTILRKRTVVLARGSYSLAAGKSAAVVVRLTASGTSALAEARGHKLAAKAIVTVTGGTTVKSAVVLSAPTRRKHRR